MNSKNWQLPLTRSQKYDLDRAIVEYIRWNYEHSSSGGFRESLATLDDVTLTEENIARSLELLFNLDGDTATTKTDTTDKNQSHALLLPRKWNSILRLQTRIMQLEQKCTDLTNELENMRLKLENNAVIGDDTQDSSGNKLVPSSIKSWIPREVPFTSIPVAASITAVRLHPLLPIAFIATDNGTLYAFDVFNPTLPLASIQAHTKGVTSLDVLLPNTRNTSTSGKSTRRGSPSLLSSNSSSGSNNRDQVTIATSSKDTQIRIFQFDAAKDKFIQRRSLIGHDSTISQVRFVYGDNAAAGQPIQDPILASCSRDCTVKFWNVHDGSCIRSIRAHNDWIRTVDVIGEYVVSGSQDTSLRLTHWPSGNGLSIGTGHTYPVERVKLIPLNSGLDLDLELELDSEPNSDSNPDLGAADTTGRDANRNLDAASNSTSNSTSNSKGYERLGFRYCVSASRDNSIKVWEVPLPRFVLNNAPTPHITEELNQFKLVRTLVGHTSWVRDLALNATGNFLFSCGDDKSLRCWNLKTGKCIKVWQSFHSGFINCLDMDSIRLDDANNPEAIESKRQLLITGGVDRKCNVLMK